ncbi:MAG: peptide synthetase [Gordonia sp. (in: high G+C Gram-positive bacteria)]|uniref:peptide synthetase n=1 Tax=Gordonia sp. (in: high G+C Gram-positive bacteria) TaxID=84139 RepID=UPI0039E2E355
MTDTLDARRELLRRRLARQAGSAPTTAPAPSADDGLGVAERRMWRIHALDPGSVSHNITLVLDCDGVPASRLVAGVEAVVANAEALGSTIAVDEQGTPRRIPTTVAGRWIEPGRRWSLGSGPDGDDPDAVAAALARTPFDLTREAPIRARVIGDTAVLSFHHLAVDDTSWPLLLGSVLAGRWTGAVAAGAAEGPAAGSLAAAVDHARATWAADDMRFPLSGERPATTPEDSWLAPLDEAPGTHLRRALDTADLAAFTAVAPEAGGTGNAALIVLIALTVTAATGAADHVLLVPADNRRADQTPDRVGYCGNIVPIRFSFDPACTVGDALRTGCAAVYRALAHSAVDFGPVLTELRTAGGRFPVVEVLASVRNAPMRGVPVPAGGAVAYRSVCSGIAPYPLSLAIEIGDRDDAHLEVDVQPVPGPAFAARAADTLCDLLRAVPGSADLPLHRLLAGIPRSHPDDDEAHA